jgi:hypothetical protein
MKKQGEVTQQAALKVCSTVRLDYPNQATHRQ